VNKPFVGFSLNLVLGFFRKLPSKHKLLYMPTHCDCHTSLKDVDEILPKSANFWTAVTERQVEDLNIILLSKCEFHENECSVSSNVLTSVSDILPIFLHVFVHSG
jgi:hypothetical protein